MVEVRVMGVPGPKLKEIESIIWLYRTGISLSAIGRSRKPPVSKQAIWGMLRRRGIIKSGGREDG